MKSMKDYEYADLSVAATTQSRKSEYLRVIANWRSKLCLQIEI
jgi:hypothetical protein